MLYYVKAMHPRFILFRIYQRGYGAVTWKKILPPLFLSSSVLQVEYEVHIGLEKFLTILKIYLDVCIIETWNGWIV